MYSIIIDDREKKVVPYFEPFKDNSKRNKNNILIKVERINIGDYCVKYRDYILFIIERKTWKDLSSSIKDGRKENVKKLLHVREEYPLCKVLYLIEGKARYSNSKKISRIPYKNLQAHLDHLIMRDGIFIIYSKNMEDTAQRLIDLVNNFISLGSPILEEIDEFKGGNTNILKNKFIQSDKETLLNIWSNIPYISTKTANVFIKAKVNITDFLLGHVMTKEDISSLEYSDGGVIGKRAKKIVQIRKFDDSLNKKYYIRMFSCIKGITTKTAKIILDKYSIKDILENKVERKQIINLKKTEKTNIGKKATDELYRFFVYCKEIKET